MAVSSRATVSDVGYHEYDDLHMLQLWPKPSREKKTLLYNHDSRLKINQQRLEDGQNSL